MRSQALSIAVMIGLSGPALGHARWKLGSKISPPRNNSAGLKTPPCGGVARTAVPLQYKPSSTITVEFEETINHKGYFEIRFLPANDSPAGMADNLLLKVIDNQDTPIDTANHQFTGAITLPSTKCDGCTLQLIQVMQDAVPDTYYYSCSDIQLVDNPQPPAETPPSGKPTDASTAKPAKPTGLKLQPSASGVAP